MLSDIEKVTNRIKQVKKDTGHGGVEVKLKDGKVVFIHFWIDEEINRKKEG